MLLSTSSMAAQNRKEFNLVEELFKGEKAVVENGPRKEKAAGKAIEKPEKGGKPEKTRGKTKEKRSEEKENIPEGSDTIAEILEAVCAVQCRKNIEGFVENLVNTKLENRNKRTPPHDDDASTSKKQCLERNLDTPEASDPLNYELFSESEEGRSTTTTMT